MFFRALNIDVALQISNKILFEEPFGDALNKELHDWSVQLMDWPWESNTCWDRY